MKLGHTTETFTPAEDQSWLGSAHGTNECDTITLDKTLLLAVFTDGVIPSGVVLGKVTATGRYGPYSNAAGDGRETASGHLFTTIDIGTGADAVNSPAALYWHGEVVEAKLPTNHGLDANGKAELTQIRYV